MPAAPVLVASAPPGEPPISPAARSWTSSARIATAISRCEVRPRLSPAGTLTRSGGDRLLHDLLVAVALGGHDDHRPPVGVGRGELPAIQQRGAPAQRIGQG